jgi:hypothetical protein
MPIAARITHSRHHDVPRGDGADDKRLGDALRKQHDAGGEQRDMRWSSSR